MKIEIIKKSFNKNYKYILINHAQALKKYNNLKAEKDDNKRGVAFYDSNSRKKVVNRIRKAFETSYLLSGSKELKTALNIIDEFVEEPLIILFTFYSMTNKKFHGSLRRLLNIDIDALVKNELGNRYNIFNSIQIYLNSACYMEPIYIENSLQIYLALQKLQNNSELTDKEINEYINTICSELVEKYNLDIEFPNYSLGVLNINDVKIKTIFCGHILLEVNEKNRKTMPQDTKDFKDSINEVINSAFPLDKTLLNILQ